MSQPEAGPTTPSPAPTKPPPTTSGDEQPLQEAELIYGPDQKPRRKIEDVELATLSWVHWYNTQRLNGYLDDVSPIEYEEDHYAQPAPTGR